MTMQFSEPVEILDSDGNVTTRMDNRTANTTFGGERNDGDVFVRDSRGREAIHLNGGAAKIRLGTAGNEGDIAVQDNEGRDVFIVSGNHATCYVGADGNEGDLFVRDSQGRNALVVNGHLAQMTLGNSGNAGDLRLNDGEGSFSCVIDGAAGALRLGAPGVAGEVVVRNADGDTTVRLDGRNGDVELLGADCAEEFDLDEDAEPGSIMVIAEGGGLTRCKAAYDRRVAGILSGAGGFAPAMTLDKQRNTKLRRPLALVGKVCALVDADLGSIQIGDLLTTSPTAGHAMHATDPDRSFGTIIGKALGSLDRGRGLLPVLVALQ